MLNHCATYWSINGNSDWHRLVVCFSHLFHINVPLIDDLGLSSKLRPSFEREKQTIQLSVFVFFSIKQIYSNPFHMISNGNKRFGNFAFLLIFIRICCFCTCNQLTSTQNVWSHTRTYTHFRQLVFNNISDETCIIRDLSHGCALYKIKKLRHSLTDNSQLLSLSSIVTLIVTQWNWRRKSLKIVCERAPPAHMFVQSKVF